MTTSPASSSCFRCFITPKRVIENRASSALSVCPSSRKSSSSRLRRVGSARALNTSSTPGTIGDHLVTCQPEDSRGSLRRIENGCVILAAATGLVEPPTALLGYGASEISGAILPLGLSFAAGAMVYVVLDELVPDPPADANASPPSVQSPASP